MGNCQGILSKCTDGEGPRKVGKDEVNGAITANKEMTGQKSGNGFRSAAPGPIDGYEQ